VSSSPRKILVIARPYSYHGGVERATAGLLHALADHGYDVHLLSVRQQPDLAGVTVHRLALPSLPASVRLLVFVASTRRFVARGGWDLVQSHERTLCQQIYRAGEGCHRGYLATRSGSARGLYHRLVLALERRIFAATPAIAAIARRGKREIETLYGVAGDRINVVYNGVDLERFHPRTRTGRAVIRSEAGLDSRAWTLLFVGSGFERKGLVTAVEALAALGDDDSRLVVIGRGQRTTYERHAARLGVADRIVWLGPRPDVERWYAAADVAVLPTRYEPFGNVHLEALASGLPIVTSTEAGGSELIEEGVNGAVVDPRDAKALATAVERFREMSAAGREAAGAAARRAAEPFTYAAQVAGFSRIYANFP
jgi:UDP-glucose:(heptosyl)LPS alpha-1,3-glucosyltransferase